MLSILHVHTKRMANEGKRDDIPSVGEGGVIVDGAGYRRSDGGRDRHMSSVQNRGSIIIGQSVRWSSRGTLHRA